MILKKRSHSSTANHPCLTFPFSEPPLSHLSHLSPRSPYRRNPWCIITRPIRGCETIPEHLPLYARTHPALQRTHLIQVLQLIQTSLARHEPMAAKFLSHLSPQLQARDLF